MNTESILLTAYRVITDPGALAHDFDGARAVLKIRPQWAATKLVADADRILHDVSPERLSSLAGILSGQDSSPELEAGCFSAFHEARLAATTARGLLPLRRAHALAEMLLRLEAFWKLTESDLLWLFEEDEYAAPAFYFGLAVWCRKRERVSPSVTDLVRQLRDEDDTSEILDRLAAWVAPSLEGMMDLACWENAFRGCTDQRWREAATRWKNGEPRSPDDAAALAPSIAPECSPNADAVKDAIEIHGWELVSRLLRETRDSTQYPIPRAILDAWLEHFGGAR